jgi:hypothetical protein
MGLMPHKMDSVSDALRKAKGISTKLKILSLDGISHSEIMFGMSDQK